MGISIVILNYNEEKEVIFCLSSLSTLIQDPRCEVIVADNGSRARSIRLIREAFPQVRILENGANLGVARARNMAVAVADRSYILSLDSDTAYIHGDLLAVTEWLEHQPKIAMVGARLINPDGTIQNSCRRMLTLPVPLISRAPFIKKMPVFRHVLARHLMEDFDHQDDRPVDYVLGACQLFRKTDFMALGGYDERIFFGPEDADLGLRIKKAGKEVWYRADLLFSHVHRRRTRKYCNSAFWKHLQGLAYYFKKHGYLFRPP